MTADNFNVHKEVKSVEECYLHKKKVLVRCQEWHIQLKCHKTARMYFTKMKYVPSTPLHILRIFRPINDF